MVCKTTFINPGKQAGLALVELMVACVIGGLVLVAATALWFYSCRSFAGMLTYADLDIQSKHALDTISQRIRGARSVKSYQTNSLTLVDADGVDCTWTWNPSAMTLEETKGGTQQVLLANCESLTFSLFQRNPVGGSYDQYPAAAADSCKLIQLQWTCGRTVAGYPTPTETVRSAKVVIRKK